MEDNDFEEFVIPVVFLNKAHTLETTSNYPLSNRKVCYDMRSVIEAILQQAPHCF